MACCSIDLSLGGVSIPSPALRFEITSPRLACVLVLLITLFWYEILMPRLSLWRARRSARIKERRRAQAIELQKLRRTATRRCRNCHTPYRDQNPGGGKFMCSYCGHISKRPVLDLPLPASADSGLLSELLPKICPTQDWLENSYRDSRCLTEKSYSGAVLFSSRLVSYFFWSFKWLWRKVFRLGSAGGDGSGDGNQKGSVKRGENEGSCAESQKEKARRKAEEKRQARLEKEMLEEEERKQREEVARLVEERRKLRDAMLEAERRSARGSAREERISSRKEAEKRRQESRREKDKGLTRNSSDVEEFDRRTASKDCEKKCELDWKSDNDRRDIHKFAAEDYKVTDSEAGHGLKPPSNRPRYFDRVKGSFLSSSKGFNGGSFWGRGAKVAPVVPVSKVAKPVIEVPDSRRDVHPIGQTNFNRAVGTDAKPPVQKKGWRQLFTRSPDVSQTNDSEFTAHLSRSNQSDAQSPSATNQKKLSSYFSDNQINVGHSLPFNDYPIPKSNTLQGSNSVADEQELFEDPCYNLDSVLLGPISESLDSLPVDLGAGFIANNSLEENISTKKISNTADVCKPSPIASHLSKLRIPEDRHPSPDVLPSMPNSNHLNGSNASTAQDQGTWQMWGNPLAQDSLGLVGRNPGWFSPMGHIKSSEDDAFQHFFQKSMLPHILTENHAAQHNRPPNGLQNGGTFAPLHPMVNGHEPWAQEDLFQPLPGEHFPPLSSLNSRTTYDSPKRSDATNPFQLSSMDLWPKREWGQHDPQNEANSSSSPGVHVGGLFSTGPDVQSVWAFSQKERI